MNSNRLTIRKATLSDVGQLAALHLGAWQKNFKGIIADSFLNSLTLAQFEARRRRAIRDQTLTNLVAINEAGQLVGFSISGKERDQNELYTAEISALYVHTDHQQKGIGKLLLKAAVSTLVDEKHQAMLIWTLADNPACKFYERCGGLVIEQQIMDIGGQDYKESAFGWAELDKWLLKWK
jgi:GNAT superfamily N-acetyltransferase